MLASTIEVCVCVCLCVCQALFQKTKQGDHPCVVSDGPTMRPQHMRICRLINCTHLLFSASCDCRRFILSCVVTSEAWSLGGTHRPLPGASDAPSGPFPSSQRLLPLLGFFFPLYIYIYFFFFFPPGLVLG